ncbi:DUF7848 domain-containing protein [Streptomyces millisiae]|uniref:DUF7848 domain-containing protein n=1 Tax=Streptomyces millisiae TaxID=3075542 RepID=A0ABU2LRJ9_9ACTN|nr:hypothetical protein [Streptomyces sp. DSM 44918]MDT0320219.1 hypothetical protein [Streptomyces sp. DSM 44918]
MAPDRRPLLSSLLRQANAISDRNRRHTLGGYPVLGRSLLVSEPNRAADAPPLTHRMRCDTCGQRSARCVEFGRVQDWQLRHAAAHPTHHTYTETLTRPWLVAFRG